VGKTAIVEGLAQRIAHGDVPQALREKRVLALSLGPLVAGTKYRGEFESRVKKIVDEIKRAGRDIILFIDELHTLVGAGAAEGSLDLSSMIKPELARGELQCIGATTFDEYRKYVESDAALERRFQPVQVDEPTIEQTVAILQGLRPKYAAHHGVTIDDEALEAAAALAARYIADRYLPDKAIDVVDEAAAGAAMHGDRRVGVDRVAAVVSRWTGIPQGTLTDAQRAGLLALEEQLSARVVGQDLAVRSVSEAIRRARAGLKDPRKPVGGFLFVGPSGVGKTELARALAHALFGTDDALIRLDLSEYTEAHTISRLLGAPPGYQGHEEAGQLTEPIRRRPYSVVLFDEIEKAHPDVAAILLQILDDGRVTDAKGRTIDFRHAIVVLTSNLERDEIEGNLRPELIDRIDELVYFKELGPREIEQIVALQVALLAERLGAHAMRLDLSDTARRFLANESSSTGSGARYVARAIARHVTTPLSEAILRGRLASGHTARVDYDGSAITVEAAA
ncbi:MAG TPA: ATP-dependent Clp protease ATP-binding subunit, partial [Candidatus Elarobacter sp.]